MNIISLVIDFFFFFFVNLYFLQNDHNPTTDGKRYLYNFPVVFNPQYRSAYFMCDIKLNPNDFFSFTVHPVDFCLVYCSDQAIVIYCLKIITLGCRLFSQPPPPFLFKFKTTNVEIFIVKCRL